MTTIVKVSSAKTREAASAALRAAGIAVVEVDSWADAAEAAKAGDAALLLCDASAAGEIAGAPASIPRDAARKLSHDLRTPLSAMAGWLHLLESGKLDEAGVQRAVEKLRGNIDDQVRTIEKMLGSSSNQEKSHS